jgi:hypothetical protein
MDGMACSPAVALATVALTAAQAAPFVVEYPVAFALVQRAATGTAGVPVRVRPAGAVVPQAIEARWQEGPWQALAWDAAAQRFCGQVQAATGQGVLAVRDPAVPTEVATVEPVLVGDLFVITGQSNADGRGAEMVRLADTNPCLGAKYRAGQWSRGDDPSDDEGKCASPWPIVLNTLIPEQRVPLGFIQAAVGSTVVRQWRGGGDMFIRMEKMIREATGGTLAVKAVLYYQGENDITHYNTLSVLGDYDQYRTHLRAMVDDMQGLLHAPVLVGQITNLLEMPERNNGVRRAQQEIWDECPQALPGAVAYDIFPTDGVHYRDARNLRAFAERWAFAVRNALYTQPPMPRPRLLAVLAVGPAALSLTFDRPLAISAWTGDGGSRAYGFRVSGATAAVLTDGDVTATELSGSKVTVSFAKPLPEGALYWYGSGSDGQGKAVLRDAVTGIPVPLVFGVPVGR